MAAWRRAAGPLPTHATAPPRRRRAVASSPPRRVAASSSCAARRRAAAPPAASHHRRVLGRAGPFRHVLRAVGGDEDDVFVPDPHLAGYVDPRLVAEAHP